MKKALYVCSTVMLLIFCLCLSGCAVGSASAAYAVRAGTADDLKSDARQSIINEAVARCKRES